MPVPRFEEYRGFWFLNFDRNAISLADYLGHARDYIDVIVDPAEQGMHIVGGVQEYSARANWKLLAENSTDILHVETLHPTYLDLVATNSGGKMVRGKMEGKAIDLGSGHSVVERRATYGRPIAQWISLWGEEAKVEIDGIYDAPDPEVRRGARLPDGEVRAQSSDLPESRPERHHVGHGPHVPAHGA